MTKATTDTKNYVVKCNRKSKMIEILLTLMHIYIIIFKESDLYYSQVILKYNLIPSGCKKSEISVLHLEFHCWSIHI